MLSVVLLMLRSPVYNIGMIKQAIQEPTFLILTALAAGPQHGSGIMPDVARISETRVRLRAGTLYAALDRLRSEQPIDAGRDEIVDGRLRRCYRLTPPGLPRLPRRSPGCGRTRPSQPHGCGCSGWGTRERLRGPRTPLSPPAGRVPSGPPPPARRGDDRRAARFHTGGTPPPQAGRRIRSDRGRAASETPAAANLAVRRDLAGRARCLQPRHPRHTAARARGHLPIDPLAGLRVGAGRLLPAVARNRAAPADRTAVP